MRIFDRLARGVSLVSRWAGGAALAGMLSIIVADVAGRTLFDKPVAIATEFSGYALVALVFLGLAHASRGSGHITIEFLLDRLPPRSRALVAQGLNLFAAVVCAWVAWLTAGPALADFALGTRSITGSNVPQWLPQATIPLGFAALSLCLAVRALRVERDVADDPRPAQSEKAF